MSADAQEEVRALEYARLAALSAHDVDAVAELMAEDLVHIHATGLIEDKAMFIAHLRKQPRRTERRSLDIRVYGEVAILTGEVVNTLTRPGQAVPEDVPMAVTQVARKQAQGWRFVSFHACRLTPVRL